MESLTFVWSSQRDSLYSLKTTTRGISLVNSTPMSHVVVCFRGLLILLLSIICWYCVTRNIVSVVTVFIDTD